MQSPTVTYLLTGSNIDPRMEYLHQARDLIAQRIGKVVKASSVYESTPWGFEAKNNFLNQVVCLHTGKTAEEVMEIILGIEREMGRERTGRGYASRTIDIDILYFDQEVIDSEMLTVPHPRIQERRFTLVPLVEIAAEFVHPGFHKSNLELLRSCNDPSDVYPYR